MSGAICCERGYTVHIDEVLPDDRAVREPIEVTDEEINGKNAGNRRPARCSHQCVLPLQESRDIVNIASNGASSHVFELVTHGLRADLELRFP